MRILGDFVNFVNLGEILGEFWDFLGLSPASWAGMWGGGSSASADSPTSAPGFWGKKSTKI